MTDSSIEPSSSRAKPPRRWGRIIAIGLLLALIFGAVALYFARSAVLRRARNEGVEVQSLSWDHLEARTANRAIPGGLGRLHAIGVKARWSPAPLVIDIEHLHYQPPANRLNQPPPSQGQRRDSKSITRDPRSRSRSVPGKARQWLDEQDWDINIKHGPSFSFTTTQGDKKEVGLKDISLKRRNRTIEITAQLQLPSKKTAPLRCKPKGDLSWDSLHLNCEAPEVFDSPVQVDLERVARRSEMSIRQGEQFIQLVRDSKKNTWHLKAERFPALWWEAGASLFSLPTLPFLKVQDKAELNIDLDLSPPKAPDLHRTLKLHTLTVSGLAIQEPRVSPELVLLPPIKAQGDLQVALRKRRSSEGTLDLQVGELKLKTQWSISSQKHSLSVRFPEQPCMQWLQAIPEAMRPALAGMTLEGQSAASFELSYDPQKREHYDESNPESVPGTLALDFPLFENCKVTQEPTLLSKAPVTSTKYKHPWPGVSGDRKPRVMGRSDRSFVSLSALPLFTKAMTVTEDPKFWDHNGFDTDAMKTAFWYDLAKLRVARGASTISQQCARMLWLGTQRNLARKLQELLLTWRLESTVSKKRILELYLNLIELGPGIHGGPDAARFYFDRSIVSLNLKESLFLATLAPAPGRKAKESETGKIASRWNDNLLRQIERLRIRGWITSEEAQDAIIAPFGLKDRSKTKKVD